MRATAITTPRKPTITLPAMFANAIHRLPLRTNWKVSHSKVENVVYAPINPTGIR